MAHAPHPTHLCKSIAIPYLGMDHLLLSLFLCLLYSHTGEPTISCGTTGQALIVIRHEVIIIAASWKELVIILCSDLSVSPVPLTIAFCYCSRTDTFPDLYLHDNASCLRGYLYHIPGFKPKLLSICGIHL